MQEFNQKFNHNCTNRSQISSNCNFHTQNFHDFKIVSSMPYVRMEPQLAVEVLHKHTWYIGEMLKFSSQEPQVHNL